MSHDAIIFADEDPLQADGAHRLAYKKPWKVLIVDDEEEVHTITTLVLRKFRYDDRPLHFLHAYNGDEAKRLISENPDTAVILLDVVMEKDDTGLEVVKFVRTDLRNAFVRIILRTGQPGQAPEEKIIVDYDINDYKEKTELSSEKLFTVMLSSLRTYRHLLTIDANREGLKNIIHASASLFEARSVKLLASGVLTQLVAILGMSPDAMVCQVGDISQHITLENVEVLAGSGCYDKLVQSAVARELPIHLLKDLKQAWQKKSCLCLDDRFVGFFPSESGAGVLLYCEGWNKLDDLSKSLVEVYCTNVHAAFENVLLNQEIEDTQKEIIYTLGEIADARSRETGTHVKRVSSISRVLAKNFGLTAAEVEMLRLAAPMHDIGKVAIPDGILNHPGKLSDEDFAIMQHHTKIGSVMLSSSPRAIMKAAAIIALQHHEKYDGTGYPEGLAGENIHVFARIVALADVYDALNNDRVYRKAFESREVLAYIKEQRGIHFDPALVDVFFDNLEDIQNIQ
ncbi:MAG: DUF3369 domain-containing protein [Proteobacteria bacterium]|nr:DUF3369 domain-containing protein [Pseudomonadota bacterium]MBU1641213.1 DUF3369 domain-containing protein [Pseudomonadota bacterium]